MSRSARRRQMIQGAHEYARFDKSDPFTFSRAMSHINNGVANFFKRDDSVIEGFYNADPVQEERTLENGEKYFVTAHKNVVRP